MMIDMEIALSADPGALSAKADEARALITEISLIIDQAYGEIVAMGDTWKSGAADELLSRFRRTRVDIDETLAAAADHMSAIKEAATIISGAEASVKTAAEGLPTDIGIR